MLILSRFSPPRRHERSVRVFLVLCALGLIAPRSIHAQAVPGQESGDELGGSTTGAPTPDNDLNGDPAPSSSRAGTTSSGPRSMSASAFAMASPRAMASATAPASVLISQFRLSGPGGSQDEFIELYNPGSSSLDLSGYTLLADTLSAPLSALSFAGQRIAPGGHLLLTNSGGYSLGGYAQGDVSYSGDIAPTSTLTLKTASGTVADSVSSLWALAAPASATDQYAFLRRLETGVAAKTGNDQSDFNLVSISSGQGVDSSSGVGALTGARLGAPGPRNTHSPIQRNGWVSLTPLNIPGSGVASDARMISTGSVLDPKGRLSLRRTLTNTSPTVTMTQLRFRIVAITGGTNSTAPDGTGTADVRAISSSTLGVRYRDSAGNIQTAAGGLALEAPSSPTTALAGGGAAPVPSGAQGGGLNSSWSIVNFPAGGLAPGASINVEFLLGIVKDGNYRVVVDSELSSASSSNTIDARLNTGAGTAYVGEGIVSASAQGEEASQSTEAGATATYFASVKRTGGASGQSVSLSVPGWADFAASGGQAHFFVGTTSQEITSDITSAGGWNTPLASGGEVVVRVEIAVPAGAAVGDARSLLIRAEDEDGSGAPPADAVKATVVAIASVQPDALIRLAPPEGQEAAYVGGGVYSLDGSQRVLGLTVPGLLSAFNVQIKNDGAEARPLTLKLPPAPQGWTLTLRDALQDGADITAAAQSAGGWQSPPLEPGAFKELRLELLPSVQATTDAEVSIRVENPTGSRADVVQAVVNLQRAIGMEFSLDAGQTWLGAPAAGLSVPQYGVLGLRVLRSHADLPWTDDPFKPVWSRNTDVFYGSEVWLHCPEATAPGASESATVDSGNTLSLSFRVLPHAD